MSGTLAIFNGVNQFLPFRGFFSLRRMWLRCAGIRVGSNTRIASGARFYDIYTEIGDHVWIGPEVSIASGLNGRVVLGSYVDIAPRTLIVSGTHKLGDPSRRAGQGDSADIYIGDGTWIGANCTIIAGAHIGRGSVIAAGSVVIAGEYPDNVLLAGVPAVIKKTLRDA
jgi:maltose O-acetyltransferase